MEYAHKDITEKRKAEGRSMIAENIAKAHPYGYHIQGVYIKKLEARASALSLPPPLRSISFSRHPILTAGVYALRSIAGLNNF